MKTKNTLGKCSLKTIIVIGELGDKIYFINPYISHIRFYVGVKSKNRLWHKHRVTKEVVEEFFPNWRKSLGFQKQKGISGNCISNLKDYNKK